MQLGEKTPLPTNPLDATIELVPNLCIERLGGIIPYAVRFSVSEFTSLCPVTGQPDFARMTIDYVPDKLLIESKSLKLFMGSFRNHGAFHEECTRQIGSTLCVAANPFWMRVVALWHPRGGIPIDVFWEYGEVPEGVCVPPLPDLEFRGR